MIDWKEYALTCVAEQQKTRKEKKKEEKQKRSKYICIYIYK
jgi:hypothetical protein